MLHNIEELGGYSAGSEFHPTERIYHYHYQAHIMVCPGYAEYRQNLDLEVDKDLVTYFGRVVKNRLDSEDNDDH